MNKKPELDELEAAIALHYDGEGAPRVTAKGKGMTAQEIIKIAEQHGIPLHADAPLTKALSLVPLGEEIPAELYLVVAEILAFLYTLDADQETSSLQK